MQAPLVYSSKQQAGINITTTSAETPGIEISMGYKSLDAAYVPVAVARECLKGEAGDKGAEDCSDEAYRIIPIVGGNNVSFGIDSSPEGLAKAQSAYSEARVETATARGELKAKADQNEVAEAERDAAQLAREQAATARALVPADGDATQAEAAKTEAQARYDRALKALEAAAKAQKAAQDRLDLATAKETAIAGEIQSIQNALADSGTNNRQDALSVYGRFDASGTGSGKKDEVTANGVVGKVFSTGVASQFIADGIARGVATTATADCIKQGTALLDGLAADARATKVDSVLALCAAASASRRN
jgi:hypothetical protein